MKNIDVKKIIQIPILLLFWGVYSSISKLLLSDYDSMSLLLFMYLFSFIAITIYMIVTKKIRYSFRENIIPYVLISILSFFYYIFSFFSLKMAPALEITTINYLFPILITIFASPINKEKLTLKKIVSLFLGFLGVLIVISKGSIFEIEFTNLLADFLMFLGALSWALFTNFSKKYVKDQYHFTFISILTQLLICIIVLPFFTKIQLPNFSQIIGSAWLGITNLVVCFLIWQNLVSRLKASTVASIGFITPFINLLAIVVILGEKLTLASVIGFLIVVVGISIQNVKKDKLV